MVGLQYGHSLISKPQKTCAISGFAFPFSRIMKPQYSDKTVSSLAPFTPGQQTNVNDICRHPGRERVTNCNSVLNLRVMHAYSGLYSDYSERYPRPKSLPENSVYVRLLFEVMKPTAPGRHGEVSKLAITELSGCVNKDDLDFTLEETSTVLQQLATRDPFIGHCSEVLPGDRLKSYRHAFAAWWSRVGNQLRHPKHQEASRGYQDQFLSYMSRHSVCYRSLCETERSRLRDELGHFETRGLDVGKEMVFAYVHSICDAGGTTPIAL